MIQKSITKNDKARMAACSADTIRDIPFRVLRLEMVSAGFRTPAGYDDAEQMIRGATPVTWEKLSHDMRKLLRTAGVEPVPMDQRRNNKPELTAHNEPYVEILPVTGIDDTVRELFEAKKEALIGIPSSPATPVERNSSGRRRNNPKRANRNNRRVVKKMMRDAFRGQ